MASLQGIRKLLLLLLALGFGVCASRATSRSLLFKPSMDERHQQWMSEYGRMYQDSAEFALRLSIFKMNLEFIQSFNKDAAEKKSSYKLGINEFADLTNEEFQLARNGFKNMPSNSTSIASSSAGTTAFMYENVTAIPPSMDWRKMGAVTPVKNQGQCGCCWAFSAVAAMEGITKRKTGKFVSLSEQELVDCDKVDEGCNGGLMDDAFKFIMKQKGLTTESDYPYKGEDGICNSKEAALSVARISGYENVPANNEMALLKAVANQPVSVAIDASGLAFQFYSSGVLKGQCGTDLDHGVTAVGYGTSGDGTKYWLVKNSWGTSWGEAGYIRMERGIAAKTGLCGIAMQSSYPIA